MRYLNKKTGAVVDSSFVISGGGWVLEGETPQVQQEIKAPDQKEEPQVVAQVAPQKVNEEPPVQEPVKVPANEKGANDAYDSITVPQIKQELDAFGIEYDKRANKQVLYDLMMSGK
ncbi:MAG TPA: hypothetical protein H9948_08680 [Candidatus Jeotgalibaca merdavium]|uniref:HeH/LEM domain-containing protein n=1 Tax=Candidatus Jeotgalibaca merdavium TaxID=2838627 RepID=A0A9D2I357_9LACT|nr:hypothetical protein [Candidatus Jeotgalibaca merdavium]